MKPLTNKSQIETGSNTLKNVISKRALLNMPETEKRPRIISQRDIIFKNMEAIQKLEKKNQARQE